MIRDILSKNGINVLTDERLDAILGNEKVEEVLTSERKMQCQMVIFAVGMRPNVELAKTAGIEMGSLGGIRVNEKMQTSAEDVFACGDCVETKDFITGRESLNLLWHNAEAQGRIAGSNCMEDRKLYSGSMNVTVLNVFDTHCASIGATLYGLEKFKEIEVIEKEFSTYYLRLLTADGKLCGIQSVGETKGLGLLHNILRRKDSIDMIKDMKNTGYDVLLTPGLYKLLRVNQCQRWNR